MTDDDVRERLRAFMRERRLTAPKLARFLKRQPQTVRLWMCGARPVPVVIRARLARLFPGSFPR